MLYRALERAAGAYPIVTVTGPRQSGKTTLVRAAFPTHAYVSLEDPDERRFALEDPRSFLERFTGPAILDEVQRAPDLFSYLQTRADETGRPGQFILSGSQNFLLLESVSQSLAGRAAVLHLLPLSLRELLRQPPTPLFGQEDRPAAPPPPFTLEEALYRGFYPRVHDPSVDVEPGDWYANYYRTYVERDVRSLTNVGDLELFSRFVRLCAGRNGQLLNATALGNDAGVTHSTVRRWLSLLESSFLITLLRPHHRNFSKRLIKSPKLYFLDPGLLCYLLGIGSPGDLLSHASRGAVFETLVLSEILKSSYHAGRDPLVYFWRDSTGHEVDFVVEREARLVAVEAKSGRTFADDFLNGLRYWEDLAPDTAPGHLVHGGDRAYRRQGFRVHTWWDLA